MCGFTVSSLPIQGWSSKVRGPDASRYEVIDGVHYLHHLLSLTGEPTTQPFQSDSACCVFNGEIYNYKDFGEYPTDGACILDLWRAHGLDFARHLDGEFAIVIVDRNHVIVATDPFACKPLWIAFQDGEWSAASYASDIPWPSSKVPGNVVRKYSMDGTLLSERPVVQWDLRQHKRTTDDWIAAFEQSIRKRAHAKAFIGLSSGYDSGAIACEMIRQNLPFSAFSITNKESTSVLAARFDLIDDAQSFAMHEGEFEFFKKELAEAEDFRYKDRFKDYDYKQDNAAVGLSAICHRANQRNLRVYLSGQGADEILSDYGFAGRKFFPHSEFGGLFTRKQKLWHSFADGTQIQYLNKEEYTAGHYGIEARYPYLDRSLVQEFLWLDADIKNRNYKSPLHDYLNLREWPYESGCKRGFSCKPNSKKPREAFRATDED